MSPTPFFPRMLRSNGKQTEYIDRKGVHVVVGKYVGSALDARNAPNFTRAELDANDFSPLAGAGADGEPVLLGSRDDVRAKRMWHLNKFNLVRKFAHQTSRQKISMPFKSFYTYGLFAGAIVAVK